MQRQSYVWKAGTRLKADAEEVGQALESLRLKHEGLLRPTDLVQAAKNPRSPLHGLFTWQDTEAARLHRENEARYILRQIAVCYVRPLTPEGTEQQPLIVRAFAHVTSKEEEPQSVYVDLEAALEDDDWRCQVIGRAADKIKEAAAILSAYEELAGRFAGLVESLEAVSRELVATG